VLIALVVLQQRFDAVAVVAVVNLTV